MGRGWEYHRFQRGAYEQGRASVFSVAGFSLFSVDGRFNGASLRLAQKGQKWVYAHRVFTPPPLRNAAGLDASVALRI